MKVEKIINRQDIKKHLNFFYSYVLSRITDRQMKRIFTEYMIIDLMNLNKKNSDFYLK